MKINDRVKVDFVSESSTEFSGKRFTGEGVVDRVEDGRVFGRLDSGVPFVCDVSDAVVIEQQAIINNLKAQFNNMEACYIEKKKQVEAVEQVLCKLKESLKDFQEMDLYDRGHRVTTKHVIADLEKALRGANDCRK